MNTKPLEKFAQAARRQLKEQVAAKLARVLQTDSAELRGRAAAVQELKQQLDQHKRDGVIERVAYTWFNRFCALRYMDVNGFTRMGVVSPAAGFTQPELLQEAKQGHIDDDLPVDRQRVLDLLSGHLPSPDPQQEAYRLLLVATCNSYYATMPFLFERIADYTELLMPDDLLSVNSILAGVREAMTPEACQDVEVIGWLYQFYISEKKDEVFAALKQNKKIAAADIPAATQLFTPHWIVRYLVENSLGRLWLLNRPQSRLADLMPYYIKPEQAESDFLRVTSPEELTVCDPASGSGHMLTYAFDLLYAIYEEEGYNPPDIPRLILEKNLYGMEIDERAGALAAFALTMKAQAKDRRFFRRNVRPNICVLQKITFADGELEQDPWLAGSGMLRKTLLHDLHLFAQADYAGSLLRPRLSVTEIALLRERLAQSCPLMNDLFGGQRQEKVLAALEQAEYLTRKYHVIVANPPYMGSKGMNDDLKQFLNDGYADVKSDLFSVFIARIMEMTKSGGHIGMMTPFNWMFLSSFEKLRSKILDKHTLTSLVRPEFHAFFDSAFVTICGFTLYTKPQPSYKGAFIDLQKFYGADIQPAKALEAIQNPTCGWFYRAAADDFRKIPGSPIAYWVSDRVKEIFSTFPPLNEIAAVRQGLATTQDSLFVRHWFELAYMKIGFRLSSQEASASNQKWFPFCKGGSFRRWYGNQEFVVNYENNGKTLCDFIDNTPDVRVKSNGRVINRHLYYLENITWTLISSSAPSFRYTPEGNIIGHKGPGIFFNERLNLFSTLAQLNSISSTKFLNAIAPTIGFEIGQVNNLPCVENSQEMASIAKKCVDIAATDWDTSETSWDFTNFPLLDFNYRQLTLKATYIHLSKRWVEMTQKMQSLEEENNRIFIEAYGLQDELTPDVPLSEITLTCNPHYRYDAKKSTAELEQLLLADTMREFISYGVGCMFGRYSLDKPGLILANQGETVETYIDKVTRWQGDKVTGTDTQHESRITFTPDKDNVIPILDGDWFTDDISERFKHFLRVTFGEAHYAENLAFLEAAIGRDLRGYFLRDFYDDHLRRYQKRPIYWLFSSPKGSFNALIYMHRYRPDTVSVVLNDYLREFITKLTARKAHLQTISISSAATARDKTAALKEIDKLDKTLAELADYENEILYPLATRQVRIDLDDGVKVNYSKFGKALRKIPGLTD